MIKLLATTSCFIGPFYAFYIVEVMQLQRVVGDVTGNNNSALNNNFETMTSRGMNSPVLYNRSFLHGDVIVNNKKHETIDSLALRRTTLPLQLVPTDIVIIDRSSEKNDNLSTDYCQIDFSTKPQASLKEQLQKNEEPNEETIITTPQNLDDAAENKEYVDSKERKVLTDTWERTETKLECEITRPKRRCPSTAGSGKLVVQPKWHFTRKVMHYVPNKSKRHKKFSKSLPKNNVKNKDKNKDLPRTVSLPTDFVHVAGNRRWSWLKDVDSSSQTNVITHEEKCATLTMIGVENDKVNIFKRSSSVETLLYEPVEKSVKETTVFLPEDVNQPEEISKTNNESQIYSQKPRANSSFLWSNIAKLSSVEKKLENVKEEYNCDNNHEYDDVGPSQQVSEEIYDDVGVSETCGNNTFVVRHEEEREEDDEQLYDDVLPSNMLTISASSKSDEVTEHKVIEKDSSEVSKNVDDISNDLREYKSSENESTGNDDFIYVTNENYSTIEEDPDTGDTVYDDVGVLYESRVNSIYAGSVDIFPQDLTKESEWEDLEEYAFVNGIILNKQVLFKGVAETQGVTNKKKSGQRRTRKVRRQRSKASRRNSARSVNRLSRQSTASVAVSLGTGSVLLVGATEEEEEVGGEDKKTCGTTNLKDVNQKSDFNEQETQGLVQLRTVDRDEALVDTQETSCYVLEDTCSDDSNYETLSSFETNRIIDGEPGIESWSENPSRYGNSSESILRPKIPIEPPSRPVPPPPRESGVNLSGTIGRRMKILKRTWSITKGSLGRMRRRVSTDVDTDENGSKSTNLDNNHSDGRKGSQVFNFKKHFQRGSIGTSTFYLDNQSDNNNVSSSNSIDEIYQNSNWSINSNYSSATDNYSEDYNMLAEEPLYQFYAASTFRGAFQSDSDSYGETEDLSSMPSTSELGKPGQRTLWCQTPQVIKSGLLERLTVDERKLQEAKFEIITSEASYLNSLRVLVNEFLINHELVYEALSSTNREKLFGNVPSVLIASERLLAELESVWRNDPMLLGLPDVLLRHAERCSKVYIEYCSNQVCIDSTLKELRAKKSSKFIETVTRIESHPACQSLTLHSFLMLPMQRVTRLPLLADAVLSKLCTDHEERPDWERVLSVLSKVVTDCNEGARIAVRQIEMEMLAKKLEYPVKVPPIELRDRYLIRRGCVTQMVAKPGAEYVLTFRKKFHKTPLYLLLLTDHLLVAKLKSNGQDEFYSVIDSCKRSVVALEKVPDDSPFVGRFAMILTLLENYCGRHVEYVLSCQSATERERWLDAVSPPKPNLVGETLYETWDCPQVMALYSYTAVQPDELSLQPGDVINVLRKMADGWNLGEKLVGGEQGWFPGNYTKEVASEHVRARNLRQRHRLLALSESFLLQYAKQTVR